MDIFWANAQALALPSSQRVEVLVHDGSTDMSLWPGPGPDRDLLDAYGPGLREAIAAQMKKHGPLQIGELRRMHPGKLHCNYLLWVATRGPEENAQQAAAPGLEVISQVVRSCIDYANQAASISIAFGPLGDGPGARAPEERLAAIVRAAHQHYEQSTATGKPVRIEVVRVCDVRGGVTASARRLVGRLAQTAPEPTPPRGVEAPKARTGSSVGRAASGKRPTQSASAKGTRRPAGLDPAEVAARRGSALPYDRTRHYRDGEWFIHAKFGMGQVRRVAPEGAIEVLFEDGQTKKLLHAQA